MKNESIQDLMNFLNRSPTAWHAVEAVAEKLQHAGYTRLHEEECWNLSPKQRYFVIRNGSSLCAFLTPKKSCQKVQLIASHTDSPGFKLKPNAEFSKENMVMLGVEVYGAPLIASWLNRDLGIAGRIVYTDKAGKISESLVRLDKHPLVIPQLAIHLDRQVNEEGVLLNKQDQLAALAALNEETDSKNSYLEALLKEYIHYHQLLSTDLFLFPLEPAALIGPQAQMIASYRIDSLNSVHAAVTAFCQAKPSSDDTLHIMALWDNEEIGSATAQGAGSPFVSHVLERATISLGLSREEYLRLLRQSLCISVDLGHAMHPNYTDKHEPRHLLLMQHGIVVKYNSQYRYASDAKSAAMIIALCHKLKIPVQNFVTRGNIPCGTTIGPIHAHTTGMPTVDIGCAQLSMHSCRELTSTQDYLSMVKLLTALVHE